MMSTTVSEQNTAPRVESERFEAELYSRVKSMVDEMRDLRAENERLRCRADAFEKKGSRKWRLASQDEVRAAVEVYVAARAAFLQARDSLLVLVVQGRAAYLYPIRECAFCRMPFQPRGNKQKYCSSQCRVTDGARRARAQTGTDGWRR